MKKQDLLFVIPCLFGLESLVADELRYAKFSSVEVSNGRVFFTGDYREMIRANVLIRSGERVQIVVGTFRAKSFEELFEGVRSLPWENLIGSLDAFPVKGYSLGSQLRSVPDCQSIIKKAIVKHLTDCYGIRIFPESKGKIQVQFSILKDQVTLMVDTSGAPLYKRGYRVQSVEAPLRESLAAGICNLARVHTHSKVADPFCGSGTLLIEAAMKARNIAPGLLRRFAFEEFGFIQKDLLASVKEEAVSAIKKESDFHAFGCDIDPAAVEAAKANAKVFHVDGLIDFSQRDIRKFRSDALPEGCITICNPPYGERLLDDSAARELSRVMGVVFQPLPGLSYHIITPSESFETDFGRRAKKRRKLYNGMLRCQLYSYF